MSNIPNQIQDLRETLNGLKSTKRDLQDTITQAESIINDPDSDGESIEKAKKQKETLEERLSVINEEIAATEEELERLVGDEENINNLAKKTENTQRTLNEIDSQLERLKDNREELNKEIESFKKKQEKIDELENSAKALLERSTSAALGEQFSDRKSELESNLHYWMAASVGSILVLLLSSGIIYYDIVISDGTAISNISKIALILPISVAVWFSVSNYNRQKRLMEEYEFKARMALSLSGFREVLHNEIPEDNENMVPEFVIDTMDKIYSNPQKNIQMNRNSEDTDPLTTGQKPLVKLIKRLGK